VSEEIGHESNEGHLSASVADDFIVGEKVSARSPLSKACIRIASNRKSTEAISTATGKMAGIEAAIFTAVIMTTLNYVD
jgi:hypothetical protein